MFIPSGSPPPREKRSPVQLSGRLPFNQSRISWRKASSGGEKRKSIRKKRHGPGSSVGRDRPAGEPHARYHDAYVRCKESGQWFARCLFSEGRALTVECWQLISCV